MRSLVRDFNVFGLELSSKLAQDPIEDRSGKLDSDLRFLVAIINPHPLHNCQAPELSLRCDYRDEGSRSTRLCTIIQAPLLLTFSVRVSSRKGLFERSSPSMTTGTTKETRGAKRL